LPDCRYLTQAQSQLLREYLNKGGYLLVMGELGINLPVGEQESIIKHRGTHRVTNSSGFKLSWLPAEPQLRLPALANLAINLQQVEGGVAIHIIRYDYDLEKDVVPGLDELILELSLPGSFSGVEIFAPGNLPKGTVETIAHGLHVLNLQDLPLYSIVLLKSISDNTN